MTRRNLCAARLIQHALAAPASLAVAMPGREITYAELLGQVESCAAWLTRRGCVASEVVGIAIADEHTRARATQDHHARRAASKCHRKDPEA